MKLYQKKKKKNKNKKMQGYYTIKLHYEEQGGHKEHSLDGRKHYFLRESFIMYTSNHQ